MVLNIKNIKTIYIIYFWFISTLIVSCYPNRNNSNSTPQLSANPDDTKPMISVIYKEIIENGKIDFLMIPVGISPDTNSGDNFPLLASRQDEKANNIYNLIFYDKTNSQSHLLLDKKAIIHSFDFLELPANNPNPATPIPGKPIPTRKYWIYRLIETDTNRDGRLTPEDGTIGYISTGDGKNLVRVTPENTQMKSWKAIADMNAILMLVTEDTDGDKQFGNRDRSTYIRVNLDKIAPGKQMIDTETEQKIKSILEK